MIYLERSISTAPIARLENRTVKTSTIRRLEHRALAGFFAGDKVTIIGNFHPEHRIRYPIHRPF